MMRVYEFIRVYEVFVLSLINFTISLDYSLLIFEDKIFRGFRGYFLSLKNIYPQNVLLSSNYINNHFHPRKFLLEANFR